MELHSTDQPLFEEERRALHKLLVSNPNYFGTLSESNFPVVQPIKFNTAYEQLTCVGLWPEKNLVEAVIEVKLPFGFGRRTEEREPGLQSCVKPSQEARASDKPGAERRWSEPSRKQE